MKNLFAALFALLLPALATAQFSISGKITNPAGDALPGATITINNNIITQSDATGNYRLTVVAGGSYTLKASFIGYQTAIKTVAVNADKTINFILGNTTFTTEQVTVTATRAGQKSPTAFTNLSKKDLEKNNLGQDLPFLLNQTPSAVTTSDAGAGIGYTGIRIRGSDATRINVTINGIPYNDSESQGTYFVDLPDFASSINNIQVQRGVGTSTNGAGAFGASINIETATRRDTAYADLNNTVGSYGTVKNTVSFGTGLLGDHFSFDGRVSRIWSNGYIDRAFSNLKSFFLGGAYYNNGTTLRLNIFSGDEKTYQAYYGVPEDILKAGNRTYNPAGLEGNGTYYKNQTDNYTQNHYQLILDQKLSDKVTIGGALHYTKGFGYYEEFKKSQALADYGITPVIVGGKTVDSTDLVRRLWLNNDFYGITYNLKYQPHSNLNFILGGAYNQYRGAHYNNIEFTQQSTNIPPDYEYSRNNANKNDFNIFGKADYRTGDVTLFADLQYRHVYYSFLGFDEKLNNVQQNASLTFFNPKAGITYDISANSNIYASFAVGNHEPNRDEYVQSTPQSRPKAENLKDFEVGYRTQSGIFRGGLNGFYMLYKNQLVLTGALNDVGAQIRNNVKDSYRYGLEFDGRLKITNRLSWAATAAVSSNKVKDFHQFLANYDNGTTAEKIYSKSDIAFSPAFVGSSEISVIPVKGGSIAFISKIVSRQYLDNTATVSRSLDPYFVNSMRFSYDFSVKSVKNIGIKLLVNNLFSTKYEANGATYPDIEGGQVLNYNYLYPQAPRNFLASLSLSF